MKLTLYYAEVESFDEPCAGWEHLSLDRAETLRLIKADRHRHRHPCEWYQGVECTCPPEYFDELVETHELDFDLGALPRSEIGVYVLRVPRTMSGKMVRDVANRFKAAIPGARVVLCCAQDMVDVTTYTRDDVIQLRDKCNEVLAS